MEIKPFKAYRFNEKVVGDVGSCIAPPYDIIDESLRERLYTKSKYNVVHITRGKTSPADSPSNNQYTRAADFLDAWIKAGVLKSDPADAIYAYVQDFEVAGRQLQRFSFIAAGKLEEFGKGVRPHEHTLAAPKIDRLNLRRATKAQFGLVFMLYEDPQNVAEAIIKKAAGQKTLIDFVDEQNVRHRLFTIGGDADISAITKMMSTMTCIIADGHHRYETGLAYYRETQDPAAAYQMMAFVNMLQPGLCVLATHRLVQNLEDFDPAGFIAGLSLDFSVAVFPFESGEDKEKARDAMLARMKSVFEADGNAFGIYLGNNAFYAAVLKNKKSMDKAAPGMSDAWKSLDVAVLHKLIFEKHLRIDDKRCTEGGSIEYVKDTGEGIEQSIGQVDAGRVQAAFFLNPTKLRQIEQVTATGERMPQKSTYFFPKVYTGLTVRKF